MRLIRCLAFLALLSLFCTCDRASSSTYGAREAVPESYEKISMELEDDLEMDVPRTDEPPAPPSAEPSAERRPKIIYTASARARVEQLDTALAVVARSVTRAGGYLASQHRRNSAYEHAVTLEIRLPADELKGTLALLPRIALNIDYENLDSRDVTAEWLDLESRLRTKRDVRDRYIDILRNRAQKVEDILNAEDKIRVITEEIEAKEGRLRYLRDQVSLSTLTLELYETQEYRDTGETYRRSFFSKLGESLEGGWELVQELVLAAVMIWPLWIIGALGVWLFRRWRKRRG